MLIEAGIRRAVGLADACELAAAAFSFPNEAMAVGLSGGSFSEDVESCLLDASAGSDAVNRAVSAASSFAGREVGGLLSALSKGSSLLYFAPGAKVPVWPYEAPFRYVSEGREGVPSLFRSPVTLDVERHMREAGVLPKAARTEPADSVWDELSFMSYLYGNVAKALHEGREADAAEWSGRIARFWDEHASRWLPDFMRKTIEEAPKHSYGVEYAALAEVGLVILDAISEDVESRR